MFNVDKTCNKYPFDASVVGGSPSVFGGGSVGVSFFFLSVSVAEPSFEDWSFGVVAGVAGSVAAGVAASVAAGVAASVAAGVVASVAAGAGGSVPSGFGASGFVASASGFGASAPSVAGFTSGGVVVSSLPKI